MSGFKVEGINLVINNLKKFENEAMRVRLIRNALRSSYRKSQIIEVAKKQTPKGFRVHKDKQGYKYLPGNLRNSIELFTGRNKEYVNVQLGFAQGRDKPFDGWYGNIVHEGYGKGQSPKPSLKKAFEQRGGAMSLIFTKELKKLIEIAKQKNGFR